jgi:hypothetical protein
MLEDKERQAGASSFGVKRHGQASGSPAMLRAEKVEREIAEIETLGLDGLRSLWRTRYGHPPSIRSPELLRLMLAWRLQAALWGELDETVRRRLKPLVGDGPSDGLPLGAHVAREWKGEVHEVSVVVDGYLWRGETYSSLSAIARAITGTRWNGPRFFGLRAGSEPRR